MMNNFTNFGFMFGLSKVFCLAFAFGLIFLIAWALKTLKKDQLLSWGIALSAVGVLGWFLAGSFGAYGMHGNFGSYNKFGTSFGMMNSGMVNCMQDEECHEQMETIMDKMMDTK